MRGGFTFCGVDIADIGLEYAPENKDTYVYAPGKSNIHEETFEGHDGGYSYGASKEPKEFILRCFYEDTDIEAGIMAKAHNLFKVGRKGMLIFKRRPWCYYHATVTEVDFTEMYNHYNGLFVITMKAYYPFARGISPDGNNKHMFYCTSSETYYNDIMANTAQVRLESLVPNMTFTTIPSAANQPILLLNPGTERAKVDIVMSGVTDAQGVTIYNRTTDQKCHYVGFNTGSNKEIYTDGINGKTVIKENGTITGFGFLYHDYGFIELEPSYPVIRHLPFSYTNSDIVETTATLYTNDDEKDWYVGKYIAMTTAWYKIVQCIDEHTIQLAKNVTSTSTTVNGTILAMNEIIVTPSQGTSLTKLSFIYKPTYA